MENPKKSGATEDSTSDESRFNETLKRMLRTPPQPHGREGNSDESSSNLDRNKKKRDS